MMTTKGDSPFSQLAPVAVIGQGYIGRNVTAYLRRLGAPVLAITSRPNVPDAITHSLRDLQGLTNLLAFYDEQAEWYGVGAVIHAAGPAPDPPCLADPSEALWVHATLPAALCDWAALNPDYRRVLYLSSMRVFEASSLPAPYHEEYEPAPSSFYAQCKRLGELVIATDRNVTLRLSSVFGVGADPAARARTAIHQMIDAALGAGDVHARPVTYGFLHIDDLCSALVPFIAGADAGQDLRTVHVQTDFAPLVEIARLIAARVPVPASVVVQESDDTRDHYLADGALHSVLRWRPKTGLENSIVATVDAEVARLRESLAQ